MNVGVIVKKIGVLVNRVKCEVLVRVIVNVIKHEKTCKYLEIKNCSCEKRLIGKLILECEDEILNATETSLDEKKETRKKKQCSHSHDFITNYMLFIIICCLYWSLLLLHNRLD